MNFSTNALGGSHASKENIPASSKIDAPPQVQRAKQRRVLGVLSENEQHGRSSLSQVRKRERHSGEHDILSVFYSISHSQNIQISTFNKRGSIHFFSPQGSHFSKPSSLSDSSQLAFLGCSSTSNYDVYVEEASEVVLAASGQEEISNSCYPDVDTAALQHEDLRLLLELSSSEFGKIQRRLYTETCGSDFIIFYRCCSFL